MEICDDDDVLDGLQTKFGIKNKNKNKNNQRNNMVNEHPTKPPLSFNKNKIQKKILKCEICNNDILINYGIYKRKAINKYINKYVCGECQNQNVSDINIDKNKNNKNNKKELLTKYYTSFKCKMDGCKDYRYKKIWTGKNAYKNWKRHYCQHHPVQPFLEAINMKLCDDQYCQNVIEKEIKFCKNHEEIKQNNDDEDISMKNDLNEDNEWVIIDGNNNKIDVRECLRHYDINNKITTEEQKEEAAKILAQSLEKISSPNISYKQKLHECVKLRLFAPTFYYNPHRGNDIIHNKEEKIRRIQLYKNGHWRKLIDRINYEQDKNDNKKERKKKQKQKEKQKENENEQQQSINQQLLQQITNIQVQNILNQNVIINESNGEINTSLLAEKFDDIKYG